MIWVVFVVVAIAVLGVFAALLASRIGYDPMAEAVASQPATGLPEAPRADDVTGVRFDTALRGYRMDQVDDVLDRLQTRLRQREQDLAVREHEIAMLRQAATGWDASRISQAPPAAGPGDPSGGPSERPGPAGLGG